MTGDELFEVQAETCDRRYAKALITADLCSTIRYAFAGVTSLLG